MLDKDELVAEFLAILVMLAENVDKVHAVL